MQDSLLALKRVVSIYQFEDSIAMEFRPVASVLGTFKSVINNVSNIFVSLITREKEAKIEFTGDKQTFIRILEEVSYSNLSPLSVTVPEGLYCSYLTYIDHLLLISETVSKAHIEVITPFVKLMSKMVSDKNVLLSTVTDFDKLKELEIKRDKQYSLLLNYFKGNETKVKYKNIVSRNADFIEIFTKMVTLMNVCNNIDHDGIINEIKTANHYLEAIKDNLENDSEYSSMVSKSIVERLANATFQVAKEIECISDFHYKVFSLNSSIISTMDKINGLYNK